MQHFLKFKAFEGGGDVTKGPASLLEESAEFL